jgi:hypothetical protein
LVGSWKCPRYVYGERIEECRYACRQMTAKATLSRIGIARGLANPARSRAFQIPHTIPAPPQNSRGMNSQSNGNARNAPSGSHSSAGGKWSIVNR